MNGPTLLVLTGIIALVLQPDTPRLQAIRKIEEIPAYIRGEVREGRFTLSLDCEEVRKDVTDVPEHAKSIWRHIRSSVLYTVADGSRIIHRLYAHRETAWMSPAAEPNRPAPRKSD
jgi:hypothetical protein